MLMISSCLVWDVNGKQESVTSDEEDQDSRADQIAGSVSEQIPVSFGCLRRILYCFLLLKKAFNIHHRRLLVIHSINNV